MKKIILSFLNFNVFLSHLAKALLVICVIFMIYGCVGKYTTPARAQAGDLVYLNLGGIKRNVGGKVGPGPVDIWITDSLGNEYKLKRRSTFKVFPEYTSRYVDSALDKNLFNYAPGGLPPMPFDGAMWLVVQLVDENNNALPLESGMATIRITGGNLINTKFELTEGDYLSIPIEVLPGSVDPNSDFIVKALEANSYYVSDYHLKIVPSDIALLDGVFGLQIKLSCAIDQVGIDPMLVPSSHDPNIQIVQHFSNGVLTAFILNPKGFYSLDSSDWLPGASVPLDLNFAVIKPGMDSIDSAQCTALDSQYSYYIDQNGNKISSVVPLLK